MEWSGRVWVSLGGQGGQSGQGESG